MSMVAPVETPCFDKGQEEHQRVQPLLSKPITDAISSSQGALLSISQEADLADMGSTTPDMLPPPPMSAAAASAAVGSGSEESSSEEEDLIADKPKAALPEPAKKSMVKGGGGKGAIVPFGVAVDKQVDEEQGSGEDEDSEEDEGSGEEEGSDEEDEGQVVVDAKTSKKGAKKVLKNPSTKKKVAAAAAAVGAVSTVSDDDGSVDDAGSEEVDEVEKKTKVAAKKAATSTSKTVVKAANKKVGKTSNKMVDKIAFVAQMMKKKTEMSVSTKVGGDKSASGEVVAKTKSASRVKKGTKSGVVDSEMSNDIGSGLDNLSKVKTGKGATSLDKKKKGTVEKSEGETDKKKRGRQENADDVVANNAKCAKLERDIELMILTVKSRSAALEKAEKELANAELDM